MDAGGAETASRTARVLVRVREAAPDDAVRAMVTELAVEAILRKTVDEMYAGDQLVRSAAAPSTAASRRSRAPVHA